MIFSKFHRLSFLILLHLILFTACGVAPTVPPTIPPTILSTPEIRYVVVTATFLPATNTPDPCAQDNIGEEIQIIHAHMREFDDASTLAASRPRDDLAGSIADLQRIRREAEDQPAPFCLTTLKNYQVSHMNTVINTLVAFLGGTDQATVDQGIAIARDQHDQYTLELARLLGVTVEPASVTTPEQTPTP